MGKDNEDDILKLVTEIVSAYVSRNNVAAEDLPNVIKSVHATLGGIQGAEASRFAVLRTPDTFSWLTQSMQGRGLGTLMRQAICASAGRRRRRMASPIPPKPTSIIAQVAASGTAGVIVTLPFKVEPWNVELLLPPKANV